MSCGVVEGLTVIVLHFEESEFGVSRGLPELVLCRVEIQTQHGSTCKGSLTVMHMPAHGGQLQQCKV